MSSWYTYTQICSFDPAVSRRGQSIPLGDELVNVDIVCSLWNDPRASSLNVSSGKTMRLNFRHCSDKCNRGLFGGVSTTLLQ